MTNEQAPVDRIARENSGDPQQHVPEEIRRTVLVTCLKNYIHITTTN
jgi:hypothetical protein